MPEIINPMKKQVVYAEGKLAFAFGSHRGSNPYRWRNKELAVHLDRWLGPGKDRSCSQKEPGDHLRLSPR